MGDAHRKADLYEQFARVGKALGSPKRLELLDLLCTGKAARKHLQELEQLAPQVSQGSLCGLGKTAPNPVLTTLRYFRDEYEAHLQGRCPAGKCRDLITYSVTDACIGMEQTVPLLERLAESVRARRSAA